MLGWFFVAFSIMWLPLFIGPQGKSELFGDQLLGELDKLDESEKETK